MKAVIGYPYVGNFNTVMQFTLMALQSHMRAMGWFKDEAGKFDEVSNKGFEKREALIKDSKTFELIGPLFLNFFRQSQYLISQTPMRVKLVPSKPEFALNAYTTTKHFKITFEEVILYVQRYTLNPSVINGHATGLKRQNAIYPLNHTEATTFTIPKGQQSYTEDRLFPDQARHCTSAKGLKGFDGALPDIIEEDSSNILSVLRCLNRVHRVIVRPYDQYGNSEMNNFTLTRRRTAWNTIAMIPALFFN